MPVDSTASEFYFRSSIKKYFIDELYTALGVRVIFDKTILYEEVAAYSETQWVVINFGQFSRDFFATNIIDVCCCTRNDSEGVELSKLTDKVIALLTDLTQNDTMRRITLYDTTEHNPMDWEACGAMAITGFTESAQNTTPDLTKVKIITTILRWGMII